MEIPPEATTPQSHWRNYERDQCAVFRKTKERFGELSNMASGFPLVVAGASIRTSEALYQACRFPHRPDIQRLILDQASPMTAKMKGKPHRPDTRPDWGSVRVPIMRWCLRVKLVQNWEALSRILLSTGNMPIVEESRRDTFWGAKPDSKGTLSGRNVLGRLLMELREEVHAIAPDKLISVAPPEVAEFFLFERRIGHIEVRERKFASQEGRHAELSNDPVETQAPPDSIVTQSSLFDPET